MNTEKSEKAGSYQLLPQPPGLVQVQKHSRGPVFSKFLVFGSFALISFVFYKAHSISCFKKDKISESHDSYIKRIEEGYL
jgi:hypothetical protein